MERTTFSFGDLVVAGGEPGPGVGLIAELRSSDCRVLHLRTGHARWVSLRSLRPARPEETRGSLEELVADLLALLGASELEFTTQAADRFRLAASHGSITPEIIDQLRARLGSLRVACLIRPQGMHRIQTIVEFTL